MFKEQNFALVSFREIDLSNRFNLFIMRKCFFLLLDALKKPFKIA